MVQGPERFLYVSGLMASASRTCSERGDASSAASAAAAAASAAAVTKRTNTIEHYGPTATRLTQKTARNRKDSTLDVLSWTKAWDEYVRGNVVSHTAAKLIERFLLNTMASSGKAADDSQSEADASEDEEEQRLQLQPHLE